LKFTLKLKLKSIDHMKSMLNIKILDKNIEVQPTIKS